MTRRMLTVKQVAQRLGVSEGFVYDHSSGGRDPRIPHFKLGGVVRFDSDLLVEFIRTWTEKCYNRDLSRSSAFARSPNTCPEIVTKSMGRRSRQARQKVERPLVRICE
jgi:excisionase family DNA binding protein